MWTTFEKLKFLGDHIQDAVHIFDFDGVLASRDEDDIYKLPEEEKEVELIQNLARLMDIQCEGMKQAYQRHLIYQAAAWSLRIPIQAGPSLPWAKKLNKNSPVFVLTARSGWHAIDRARSFLEMNDFHPVEMFHIGRVSKNLQLRLLREEYPQRDIYFYEDNIDHLHRAREMGDRKMKLIHVDCKRDLTWEESSRGVLYSVLHKAIADLQGGKKYDGTDKWRS